ncbi:MAG TPA: sulfatase-like hydrolase/transferase, partial [Planctomycetota bacterium]|nr:sulfatase-like hydrolase/transferase [Planctomycetota bacterium]
CIGKWGLGPPGSHADPNRIGFDRFFGYNCQRQAHTFYPTHLWRNDAKLELDGKTYSHDLLEKESLEWVRANKAKPFFLYLAYTIPHVALQVPDDSLDEYKGKWEETPYTGGKGYVPHPTPRAALAAMITRLDRSVGRLTDLLRELGLDKNTIVIFTSDNGAVEGSGGSDLKFFAGNGPLRDGKGSLYEGGIRVPFIAWGKGVPAGKTSDVQGAFYDMPATLCALAGADAPPGDGRDLSAAILGRDVAPPEFLYWEFPSYGGQQAVRMGDWKGVRTGLLKGPSPLQLYDLRNDLGETTDVAAKHPDVVARIEAIMKREHEPSALWRMKGLDGP